MNEKIPNREDSSEEIASRLKMLQKVTKAVYSSFDLKKIFTQIADEAVQAMGYTTVFILIYNAKKDCHEVQAISSRKGLLPQITKVIGFSLKGYEISLTPDLNDTVNAIYNGQIVVSQALKEILYPVVSEKICATLQKMNKTKNYIVIPLDVKNELRGAVFISSGKETVSESELEMLKSFRYVASHAISNASLLGKTETMKESLEKEKAYLDQLLESSQEAVVTTDVSGKVVRVNSEFARIFGYSKEDAVGRFIDDLLAPQDLYEEASNITDLAARGKKHAIETKRRCKDGKVIDVSLLSHPIKVGGQQVGSYAVYRDISKRKNAEEKIKTSLREKEVLLQEIHHRVKNNMQIISSLIHLQSARTKDEKTEEILRSSQNRIKSMAIIHEKVYQSDDFTKVDLSDYVRSLTKHLLTTFGVDKKKITFHIDIKDIQLDINKAIPCSLIINELLTNSIKHAFSDGKKGEISISIQNVKDGKYELLVRDNGEGIPDGLIEQGTKTLGLTLVRILAEEQLKGSLHIDGTNGARFRVVF
ncbi:MAG: PAS domain S-box protein [Candidatus Aminicenantes bacterium]|nr:PAS domain S-box protein [Candidatus Aminicenantes bacterium]